MNSENKIPHILFLSNLIESKGVFVLLDALKTLKNKGYSFICDFVGGETAEIDSERFSKEIKRRGLDSNCVYHGRKVGDEKEHYWGNTDIIVHPTYEDCFPLVILEAMSYGVPVISTNEGAIKDIIDDGETGLIAEKRNSADLADKIAILLDDSDLRQRIGEAGNKKFKRQFTIEAFEQRLCEILKKLT